MTLNAMHLDVEVIFVPLGASEWFHAEELFNMIKIVELENLF